MWVFVCLFLARVVLYLLGLGVVFVGFLGFCGFVLCLLCGFVVVFVHWALLLFLLFTCAVFWWFCFDFVVWGVLFYSVGWFVAGACVVICFGFVFLLFWVCILAFFLLFAWVRCARLFGLVQVPRFVFLFVVPFVVG